MNDLWLQVCGFSREEVVGRTMEIIQGPETEQDRVAGLMDHVRRRQPFNTVLTNYAKTGQPFRNDLHVEPVDAWSAGLRGPHFLARSRISLLTKRSPKPAGRQKRLPKPAGPQSTTSDTAGYSRQMPTTRKSAPTKAIVPIPSTSASPFFQPKQLAQKESDRLVRLAAVARCGSY